MSCKVDVVINLSVDEPKKVQAPNKYQTPFIVVGNRHDALTVIRMLKSLQKVNGIQNIIESPLEEVLIPFCMGMIKKNLSFVSDTYLHTIGTTFAHYLFTFRLSSGISFQDSEIDFKVISEGEMWDCVAKDKFFKTYREALDYNVYVASRQQPDYINYEVV